MATTTFKRSRPDGWSVYYEVDVEAAGLLELKGMVAANTDASEDYGTLLTRLIVDAALSGRSRSTSPARSSASSWKGAATTSALM